MERLNLDSDIIELGLSARAYNSLKNSKINTIGDIICHPKDYYFNKEIRNCGQNTAKEIITKVTSQGFVFFHDVNYLEQLKNDVYQKLGISCFSLDTLNDKLRSKLLNLKIYELILFIPDIYKIYFTSYPYQYLKLRDILDATILSNNDKYTSITSKEAYNYIYYIGANRKPWVINKKNDDYQVWINVIHELGFLFSDEEGYKEKIAYLDSLNSKVNLDSRMVFLKTKIEEFNLSYRIYSRLKQHNINTGFDIINHPKIYYLNFSYFGKESMKELEYLVKANNLLFYGEDGYEELIISLKDNLNKLESINRFELLSSRLSYLMKEKATLEEDNLRLKMINAKLAELINNIENEVVYERK